MKLRYFFLALFLVVLGVFTIAGFRGDHFSKPPFEIFPDMNYQDKVKDQVPSSFFADGAGSRPPVPGTVAEEMPGKNDYWATGKWDATHWGTGIPVHDAIDGQSALQVDAANMERGRERFSITCEACHGAAGDGKGITSKYGITTAANYHTDMYRKMSDGEIFNTITNGKGLMFGFGYNITIDDRWRIIMYLRALQRSQYATLQDASPDEQAALQAKAKPAAAPAPAPAPGAQPAPAAAPAKSASNKSYKTDKSHSVAVDSPPFDARPDLQTMKEAQ
jgi:mono/diheme cytochrome c family protein